MRVRFFVILVLLFSMFVTSCQKELGPYSPSSGSDSTNVPADTTSNDSSSVDSYQPTTAGSFWKYKDTTTGTETTNSIGDSTKIINGIFCHQYLSTGSAQTATGWIASRSPNYYLIAQGTSPNTGAPFDLTFYYLIDTASVGYSWNYTAGTGNGFTAYTTTKVVAKGITMTVEGKTYTNVIQTHQDLSYNLFGIVTNNGGYDYFIAKGIGFIKIRFLLELDGVVVTQTCSNLTDYQIQ